MNDMGNLCPSRDAVIGIFGILCGRSITSYAPQNTKLQNGFQLY
jgi:hypothetical protein